jgi:hypothetical protein
MELEATLSIPKTEHAIHDFPQTFHSWMTMSFGQFERTEEWFHNQILLDTIRDTQRAKRYRIVAEPVVRGTFEGTRQVMWRHRCIGVAGYSSLLIEYQVCDVGNAKVPLIAGTLELWHSQ